MRSPDPERLASVPLFKDLSKEEIERLARSMDEIDFPEGKLLLKEGASAYEFFIIEEGTASVRMGGKHIRDLGPGDFFGEIALLEADRRTASVKTTSPMRAIVMQGWDLRGMDDVPEVMEQIKEKIRERLAADREGS